MFKNPFQTNKRGFFHFLLWMAGYYRDRPPIPPPPAGFSYPNALAPVDRSLPQAMWVNHSTFLIQTKECNFLTDPIWSLRCSPFSFCGPKRCLQPPFSIEELPKIDVVLISHNHYDHLDLQTVMGLNQRFPKCYWIVAKGIRKWLSKYMPQAFIEELAWGEKWENEKLEIAAVPSQHFSGRGFFDRDKSGWNGYVVHLKLIQKTFYFVGDTGYNPHDFKQIGATYGPMDLSLIPIGAYLPRKFMHVMHIHPKEAVKIHQDAGSKLSIAGHFGTFRLSEEDLNRPPYDLYLALKEEKIPFETFRVLVPGQAINW